MKLLRIIRTFLWFMYIRWSYGLFDSPYWSYKQVWKFAKDVEDENTN